MSSRSRSFSGRPSPAARTPAATRPGFPRQQLRRGRRRPSHRCPVRGSKTPHGPVLRFPTTAWTAFLDTLKGPGSPTD
ncbi:DUF397 domain-containing protein [Streptomyces sp. INA 01156]